MSKQVLNAQMGCLKKQNKQKKETVRLVINLIHHRVSDLSFTEAVRRKTETEVVEIMIVSTYPTESQDGFRRDLSR